MCLLYHAGKKKTHCKKTSMYLSAKHHSYIAAIAEHLTTLLKHVECDVRDIWLMVDVCHIAINPFR